MVVKGDTGAAEPTLLIDDVAAIDWVVSPYLTETLPTLKQLEVRT